MSYYEFTQFKTRNILFSGHYPSAVAALEDAARQNVCLSAVELKNLNLDHVCLDDAILDRAVFHQCSLRHANLSEAILDRSRFLDCDLSYACLAEASLKQTSILETPMAHAEMAGAHVENMVFSCPSALDLDYSTCRVFKNSIYIHNGKIHCLMTKQPIIISGLKYKITLMNEHIKIGCLVKKYHEIPALNPDTIERLFGPDAHMFQKQYAPFVRTAALLASENS